MRIREATIDDLVELVSLASQMFTDTYDDLSEEELSQYELEFFSKNRVRQCLEDPDVRILVAEERRLIGYALLQESEAPNLYISSSSQIECVRLFVDRALQGQNLGPKLLKQALSLAGENGYDVLWLKVWVQNEKAVSFYKSKGFSYLGTVPYTDGGMNDQVLVLTFKTGISKENGIQFSYPAAAKRIGDTSSR